MTRKSRYSQPFLCEPTERREVVYSAEMARDPRVDGLEQRVNKLEDISSKAHQQTEVPGPSIAESFAKKYLPYVSPSISILALCATKHDNVRPRKLHMIWFEAKYSTD